MNNHGVETVIGSSGPLEAWFEIGEAVPWSRRRKENGADKGSRETIE